MRLRKGIRNMKRLLCILGAALCIGLLPHLCKTYGDTFASGIQAEAGFHMIAMPVGADQTLTPSDLSSGQKQTWRSSAPDVATVSSDGRVHAQSAGTAVVYVTSAIDSSQFDSWVIHVTSDAGSLAISARTAGLTIGQSMQLTAQPSGAASGSEIRWCSTDAAVARVSSNGVVTAVANGSAVIYAETADGRYTASCMVYVIQKTVNMTKSTASLPEGKTLYNKSSDVSSGKIIWTTNNADAAVVRRGYIEAVGQGQAIVTAIKSDGTGAQCTVNVTAPDPVVSAYMDPNNPIAGEASTLVAVASPQVDALRVRVLDSAGTQIYQDFSAANATYTEKTVSGRTVRIWRIPITLPDTGKFIIRCTSESEAAAGFSRYYGFYTIVSPAGEDTSESGVCRSWYASSELLRFLTQYEGLCQTVVYDVVNVPTIGYGQALFFGSEFYNYQTTDEAWGNMCKLVNQTFVPPLNTFISKNNLLLNQAQFDALISYSYNMGYNCWQYYGFHLKRLLIQNPDVTQIDRTELKYAFGKQSWTGGYFYEGLYRRRMDEWEMFLTGDYNVHPYNGGAGMTGDFAVPVKADREDPEKYKSDWRYLGAGNWTSTG